MGRRRSRAADARLGRDSACLLLPPCCWNRLLRCRYLLLCSLGSFLVAVVVLSGPPATLPLQQLPKPDKQAQATAAPPSPKAASTAQPLQKDSFNNTTPRPDKEHVSATVNQKHVVAEVHPKPPLVGEVFHSNTYHAGKSNSSLPTIYVVTPTYRRLEQQAELTRLSQTLMHVPALHWIVVEDANQISGRVRRLLRRSQLNYTHMLGPKPARFVTTPKTGKGASKKKAPALPRGVSNRLAALDWVRKNVRSGVLYFADDDNSYDVQLFEEMRWTKKVSMWPVGLVTHLAVSSPIVKAGRIIGFYDGWIASRKFPVDMAGFAVNIAFMLQRPNVTMPFMVGYEEDGFLRSLNVSLADLEPKASNCTEVLVWHTKTVANKIPKRLTPKEMDKYKQTNVLKLQDTLM